ncbi:MAG: polyprenol monophosphomannose synthase [Caldilineales bacterium]|nr:polyprenol monophosphomannose synthase [Caldilineales bacterium]
MAAPLVCTVLPTYNERHNIGPLIERLLAVNPAPYLVLVVDDDSPDGTAEEVERLIAQRPCAGLPEPCPQQVRLIRRRHERGLTSAIQRGIDEALDTYGADIVTWMDCDLSMPPEDVPRLVRAIVEEGADVAVGSRWIPGGADVAHGAMARTLSWIINQFAMALLSRRVHDYTSGFMAVRGEVLRRLRLRGDYGEYCIDLLARALRGGYRVVEVPYVCVPRVSGESKTGVDLWDYLSKGRKYVATVVQNWRERGQPP